MSWTLSWHVCQAGVFLGKSHASSSSSTTTTTTTTTVTGDSTNTKAC
jgi:hypothetical protein